MLGGGRQFWVHDEWTEDGNCEAAAEMEGQARAEGRTHVRSSELQNDRNISQPERQQLTMSPSDDNPLQPGPL